MAQPACVLNIFGEGMKHKLRAKRKTAALLSPQSVDVGHIQHLPQAHSMFVPAAPLTNIPQD